MDLLQVDLNVSNRTRITFVKLKTKEIPQWKFQFHNEIIKNEKPFDRQKTCRLKRRSAGPVEKYMKLWRNILGLKFYI